MNQKYERQLKKGVLDILVLELLSEREMYGYQIIQTLQQKNRERFSLKEGTLYPILYRLEDDGWIESRWSEPKVKMVSKKYYAITELGKMQLQELKELWFAFSKEVSEILRGDGNE